MITATLVTKHHKLRAIAPPLTAIGWQLDAVEVDTDVLGTFAGDVPRRHPPLETARRKALLGAPLSDAAWLVASEGSISHWFGGVHRDTELVVAVDRASGTTVAGRASLLGITCVRFTVDQHATHAQIAAECADADLPRHRLIATTADHAVGPRGDLATVDAVLEATDDLRRHGSAVVVQTDLRAHVCPSRHDAITAAASDLATRLTTPCPSCHQPGFGEIERLPGLACARCSRPTPEIKERRLSCPWCGTEQRELEPARADPARCGVCNP
jgi:hypothetical protein